MAIKIGEVFWKISGDTKDIDKSLKGTETKMGKFAKAVKGAFITTAVIAFGKAAFDLGKKLVLVASNAEETAQKFNVVFDGLNNASEAAANLADNYGLSNQASQDLLSSTADLLQGFGVAKDESLELSLRTQELAVDLASFSNFAGGAKGASEALTKALLGERESVKALGIAITEAELKRFAEEGGQVYSEMTKAEKAVLTLDLAIQQSANSIGDFERSEASFANQTRIAQANIDDLSASFGEQLLPISTAMVTKFNELTTAMLATREEGLALKDALKANKEGQADVNDEIAILEARLGRGGLMKSQREATQARIDQLNVEAAQQEYVRARNQDSIEWQLQLEAELLAQEAEDEATRAAWWEREMVRRGERDQLIVDELDAERERVAVIEELQEEARLNQIARDDEAKQAEQERHDARIQHLLDELDAASKYAGDAGTIFNNLIQLQMAGDDELTDRKKRGIIALYRLQQSANIAQIAINTATAIVRALADLGPIAGGIASGFIAGIGLTQAAVVAATPPPVALADGGVVPARPGGTAAILGEQGQSEAVIPLDDAGLGAMRIIVNIDGQPILDTVQSGLNRREIVVQAGSVV